MNNKKWLKGFGIGAVVGFVVAATATFMDWRVNPAGIFHNAGKTNWAFVWETAVSWFVPVAAAVTVAALLVLYVVSRRD